MQSTQEEFLFDLLSTVSPTGYEVPGQKVWAKHVRNFASQVENDAYGNTWAVIEGTGSHSIMIEAHADEIGFVVKHISKEGFLSIDVIGGSDVAIARGRFITIFGEKGEVPGIIGNTAIHIRNRKKGEETAPEVHELSVDIGAKDEQEVKRMGIHIGNPGVYTETIRKLGKHVIAGRALDNRIGGFVVASVLERISKGKKPTWTVYGVNAVQEEIGGFGAKMVTHRLSPDCAIVIDVTHATDSPGIKHEQYGKVCIGMGPTVTYGGCNHPHVVAHMVQAAKTKKIPLQEEAVGRFSGTDTSKIYDVKAGIPSALLSIPLRYMHSPVEMLDLRDVDRTIDLLTEAVLTLKRETAFGVKI